tara:strand:- start:274 stop:591 length:318 start_codon:yes stop_codon:yes gene_type:complete
MPSRHPASMAQTLFVDAVEMVVVHVKEEIALFFSEFFAEHVGFLDVCHVQCVARLDFVVPRSGHRHLGAKPVRRLKLFVPNVFFDGRSMLGGCLGGQNHRFDHRC